MFEVVFRAVQVGVQTPVLHPTRERGRRGERERERVREVERGREEFSFEIPILEGHSGGWGILPACESTVVFLCRASFAVQLTTCVQSVVLQTALMTSLRSFSVVGRLRIYVCLVKFKSFICPTGCHIRKLSLNEGSLFSNCVYVVLV